MVQVRLAIGVMAFVLGVTGAMAQAIPPVAGIWDGTYRCSQGLTALHLVVDAASDGTLTAVFDFSGLPSGSMVPSGSFRMQGTFDPSTGRVVLQPRAWSLQPPGFVMVGLNGLLECSNMRFRGRVTGGFSCSTFDLHGHGTTRCDLPDLMS